MSTLSISNYITIEKCKNPSHSRKGHSSVRNSNRRTLYELDILREISRVKIMVVCPKCKKEIPIHRWISTLDKKIMETSFTTLYARVRDAKFV
jgi:hypothetical protein